MIREVAERTRQRLRDSLGKVEGFLGIHALTSGVRVEGVS